MDKCKKCETQLDNYRIHLGYTECTDCSETEKYSAHTVYPHKTGGYIQPVSSAKKKHLTSIDRRSSTGNKPAKGIVADKSWDRWLKEYLTPKEDKPKFTPKPTPLPIYIPIKEAMQKVLDKFDDRGYQAAYELTQSLYTSDKISLAVKSQITNELTELASMTVKQRKFLKRL